jgi:RNA polymerase sigma factor (sigma-70 family)
VRGAAASTEELGALYEAELPRFVRAATAITGDEGLGREAVQEAFANALRQRRSFRREVPLEAWVWRIVVNAALSLRRRIPVEDSWDPEREGAASTNGLPDQDVLVRQWVAALPERQRLMVFLRYFADRDYRTIAAALEVEVGTVSATLSAAHAALRRSIQKEVRR